MNKSISPSRTYVAMCSGLHFKGYHFRKFVLPGHIQNTSEFASGYFLNVLDAFSCIDGVLAYEDYLNISLVIEHDKCSDGDEIKYEVLPMVTEEGKTFWFACEVRIHEKIQTINILGWGCETKPLAEVFIKNNSMLGETLQHIKCKCGDERCQHNRFVNGFFLGCSVDDCECERFEPSDSCYTFVTSYR